MAEKGYMFLLGLFFKKLGLKETLVRQVLRLGLNLATEPGRPPHHFVR
jgi:hypothetical protein